jgi:hypothetical protein
VRGLSPGLGRADTARTLPKATEPVTILFSIVASNAGWSMGPSEGPGGARECSRTLDASATSLTK